MVTENEQAIAEIERLEAELGRLKAELNVTCSQAASWEECAVRQAGKAHQASAREKRTEEALADMELGLCAHNEPTVPVQAVGEWIAHVRAALRAVAAQAGMP